jgi:hypothetical protein
MSEEFIDILREGITRDIQSILDNGSHNAELMYQVVQSYLLLQILDKLSSIDTGLDNIYWDAREYHER